MLTRKYYTSLPLFFSRFYELDMHFSLRRNLNKKKIIEFPTIYVVLKHQKDEYELVDSGKILINF